MPALDRSPKGAGGFSGRGAGAAFTEALLKRVGTFSLGVSE
ncbi:hypothetical protein [Streptomyces sp. AS13]|nr:hypothetical protein [Streptomyces sp. AS13]